MTPASRTRAPGTRASALRALLLASPGFMPMAAAAAQDSAWPVAQTGTADANRVLLDQAARWRDRFEPGKADMAVFPDSVAASMQPSRRYAQYAQLDTATDALPEPLPEPVTREYAQFEPSILPPALEEPFNSPFVSAKYAPFTPDAPDRPAPDQPLPPALVLTAQRRSFGDPEPGDPFGFGASPQPFLDEPRAPGVGGNAGFRNLREQSTDPLTAQINDSIQQIEQETAPRLEGALSIRGRSGAYGLSELFAMEAPVEASFSPNGYGRLKVIITPTVLYAGSANAAGSIAQFGTNPLGAPGPLGSRYAAGSAFDLSYAYGLTTVDAGATPLGFRTPTVVGGVQFAPKLTDTLTLRAVVERRAVTDSLLAFAGERDGRTGTTWGGVTRNRGHVQLEGAVGQANFYVGAGGGFLLGNNVASNSEIDAGAGVSYPVWHTDTQQVRLGTDLVYFGYDKNLGGFTLGQGGYFSPQQFFAVLFPVTYRDQVTPDLSFGVGGSIGYQVFRSKASLVFPNNPGLQAQLAQRAASGSGATTTIAGIHGAGIAGGFNGEIDYRLYQNLHIGARAGLDRSGNFTEGTGLVYARYMFNDSP